MKNTNTERSYLVVTGSSAGGIESLSRVLGALPAVFPAPIVVAQHLDPNVKSSLHSILSKRTSMEVVAVDSTAQLRPATVYVVPADRHVEVSDHCVTVLNHQTKGRPKPSVDLLFTSAAAAYAERLIAVVLSGLGSDGTEGARAVKLHGGTVIIENPLTAAFPSMPASLEPSMIDIVAPVERIGTELARLVNEAIDMPDDSTDVAELLERVRATSGIDFTPYKPATIRRRLASQISASGCKNIAEYRAYLEDRPAELTRLVSSFLIKVTEFFRDGELFDTLRESVVPELIERARHRGGHELRFWSAGCATGEEAYSLAILVAEALQDDLEQFKVRIFGTDIDEAAISFARRGIYPQDSVTSLDPVLVDRYFSPVDGGGWEVGKQIRSMIVFGQHDLGQRAPFPRIDLALCRNVLIYFSKDLQQRTLQVFAFSLRTGGYLALGKAETTNPLSDFFVPVSPGLRLFRRYGERVMIPPVQIQRPFGLPRDANRSTGAFPQVEPALREGRATINEQLGAFLTNSMIGVILVDSRYDILSINAAAREMFNIHGIALGDDVVHLMLPESASAVRSMLDVALTNQQPEVSGGEIAVATEGTTEQRHLRLMCYPEVGDGSIGVTRAVILAVDVTELAEARRSSDRRVEEMTREMQQLRQAETVARDSQRSLAEANKQLAAVNAQLRSHNDSLVINAEESEAATEEVETLNEEMQATNEELETLNEEFQATIEELNTTNDEHDARAIELEAQLQARDIQRREAEQAAAALAVIVDGLSKAVAAVDASGTIVVASRLFREIEVGAPDSSVQIDDDSGATIPLRLVLRRAGEGRAFTFVYRSLSADQSLTVYSGRAQPLADSPTLRSIIELQRQHQG